MADSVEKSQQLFIRRWGEMGANWGISRTMAEIHALLFVTSQPICTDDVMERLQVSRGNASVNLRQLLNWGLIHREHKPGDRKEYFACETDVWQMFQTITRERRRREVEPIVETIDRCRVMVDEQASQIPPEKEVEVRVYRDRLTDMQVFLRTMNEAFNLLLNSNPSQMKQLATMLSKAAG